VDVLETVPSVSVDIEGNVSLRGSSNFTVLIDGRPSILEPSEALQQIPASSIENIEIITNPSAKYNPEGTAGIINIIMKKKERQGRSATFNMNAGWDDKYGGDVLVEQKTEKIHATVGLDYSRRRFSGSSLEELRTTQNGETSFVFSDGGSLWGRRSLGLRGELQLLLSSKDVLTFGGRYGDRKGERDADLNYDEWSMAEENHLLYTSVSDRERSGNFFAANVNYQRLFNTKGHELYTEFYFDYGNSDEETINELIDNGQIIDGQRSTESGPGKEFRAKVDYAYPFGDEQKLEAGYQSELDRSEENNGVYEYDTVLQDYVFLADFSHSADYNRNIHSVYAIYAGEWRNFGYQGGLRGEYTYRTIDFSGETFTIDRWDYFPTIHASYKFSDLYQVMASYTRRIDRPRGWHLEPFETWIDAYNVRVGNPGLLPEYIDSYEAGFQTHLGKTLLTTEGYYRVNHNKIERVRSVYSENVTLHSLENVGTDYALGSEVLLDFGYFKNWNINLTGNLYHYRVEGTLLGEAFSRESFNWSLRLHNVIKFGKSTQVQINGRYNSPSVSSQGRREGFFVTDLALKQEFFKRRASATLQIRDVFGTAEYEYTSEGADFFNYNYFDRESPIVMLNLRYSLNHKRPDREREGNREGSDYGEEF